MGQRRRNEHRYWSGRVEWMSAVVRRAEGGVIGFLDEGIVGEVGRLCDGHILLAEPQLPSLEELS
jgi:hypothetical protein